MTRKIEKFKKPYFAYIVCDKSDCNAFLTQTCKWVVNKIIYCYILGFNM